MIEERDGTARERENYEALARRLRDNAEFTRESRGGMVWAAVAIAIALIAGVLGAVYLVKAIQTWMMP